jgi:hypothetical protein
VVDVVGNINISNCLFRNFSSTYNFPDAGAVYLFTDINYNGHYNISNNTFYDIKSNKSVFVFYGYFLSFLFKFNTFCNVSSSYEGGVYLVY